MKKRLDEMARETMTSRDDVYGTGDDSRMRLETLGVIWSALIRERCVKFDHVLTASDVCALLVALKLQRIIRPTGFSEDSYIDAVNYLTLGHDAEQWEVTCEPAVLCMCVGPVLETCPIHGRADS